MNVLSLLTNELILITYCPDIRQNYCCSYRSNTTILCEAHIARSPFALNGSFKTRSICTNIIWNVLSTRTTFIRNKELYRLNVTIDNKSEIVIQAHAYWRVRPDENITLRFLYVKICTKSSDNQGRLSDSELPCPLTVNTHVCHWPYHLMYFFCNTKGYVPSRSTALQPVVRPWTTLSPVPKRLYAYLLLDNIRVPNMKTHTVSSSYLYWYTQFSN
jgi:hypothetical protein